jgi:hypothetical protein
VKLERLAFIPDLAIGLVYLSGWVVPGLVGAGAAGWLVLGIELEVLALLGAFLVAMALVLMLDPTAKLRDRALGGAIIVVLVALAAFQVTRHQFWWPAIALAVLLGNRLLGLVTGGLATEDARMRLLVDALMGLLLYVFATAPTFYLPVPALGGELGPLPPEHAHWCAVPGDFVADFFEKPATGDWCAEPHRALAGGALYFLASALLDARRTRRRRHG